MRRALRISLLALLALLASCAAPPAGVTPAEAPTVVPLPYDEYRRLADEGKPVLHVDPALSLAVFEVRRTGSLAALGHDHVVASHAVQGFIAPRAGRADVVVALATLAVDEPSLRREAGMTTQPSAMDVEGTRRNMLGPVLEVDRHPFAAISVRNAQANSGNHLLPVRLTLHGVERRLEVPVSIDVREGAMTVSGSFSVVQTDFGIVPLSLLGGALAVRDKVDIRFRLTASPVESN